MPDYCCVPICKTRGSGHSFPKDTNLRKKWLSAIKRADPVTGKSWQPSKSSKVCSKHFKKEDYKQTLLGERKRLVNTAIPSLECYDSTTDSSPRSDRAERRATEFNVAPRKVEVKIEEPESFFVSNIEVNELEVTSTKEVTSTITVESINSLETYIPVFQTSATQTSSIKCQDKSVQSINNPLFSIFNLHNNTKEIKYFTSFNNFEHFMFFFHVLGPATTLLGLYDLAPENQLFLTLLKLRQAKDDVELGILFGIRAQKVSIIFNTWINFLYFQFQDLDIWPSRKSTDYHMPVHFKKLFPKTRVILDATEIPIQKPHPVAPQRETFSTYKNRNTLKVMVGISPRGTVSYLSDTYGGSTSDRQIIERSTLLTENMFEDRDSIMADRGIMVQDLFAAKNVYVNTPTMLRGKSQLEPNEVQRDRKVASKRIHVERVIALAKTYKILQKPLHSSLLTIGNRIISVCFNMCNFRNSIVGESA